MSTRAPKGKKEKKKQSPAAKTAAKMIGARASVVPDVVGACAKCNQVHKECTAHKRRKSKDLPFEPCGARPDKGSNTGKCKFHGGRSLKGIAHPEYKHGHRSKYHYLPAFEARRVEEMAADELHNLEENIRIQRALESRYFEHYTSIKDKKKAEAYTLEDLNKITERIQSLHESQRKLTDSLIKCRKSVQETYTREMWNELMAEVLQILHEEIYDRDTRARIQNRFAAHALANAGPVKGELPVSGVGD